MSRTRRFHYYELAAWRYLYAERLEWWFSRDKKEWNKPPRWFKRMKARIRRAKENDAMRHGRDPERTPKTDTRDWN